MLETKLQMLRWRKLNVVQLLQPLRDYLPLFVTL